MLSAREQHSRFIILLKRHEFTLTMRLTRAKNRFIRAAAEDYISHPNDVFYEAYTALVKETRTLLSMQYRRMIKDFGAITMSGLKSVERKDDEVSAFEQFVDEWIEVYSLQNARLTASTTRSDVRDAIQQGIDEGLGNSAISRLIRKVTRLSRYRAEVISRTETHNAATFGSIETVRAAQEETGVKLFKYWVATKDERTRVNHLMMNSHKGIPLDAKFNVGGVPMDRPGDPKGGAKNVINCRCVLVYRAAPDDEE